MFFRREKTERTTTSEPLLSGEMLRKLESLSLASRRGVRGGGRGERRGTKRGSGVEFCDHRTYVPGDDIKHLDWLSLLRHDRLVLRLYEEEADQRTDVVLDASASMATSPEKWLLARKLTAALAFVALTSLDRVAVHLLHEGSLTTFGPGRGRGKVLSLLRFLDEADAKGTTDLSNLGALLDKKSARPDALLLVSDFFDPGGIAGPIEALHYRGHSPTLLELHDSRLVSETLFGEYEVVDVETKKSLRAVFGKREREVLEGRLAERSRELRKVAIERGLLHFRLEQSLPFEDLVLSVLRRGGLFG